MTPSTNPQSILVVIPTLNEAGTIEGVIRSLSRELPSPDSAVIQFVVVDGGSTDGTVEAVRQMMQANPRLRYVSNPRRIQSAAVNLAVRHYGSECDVLVRCDAHAEYPDGYIRDLAASLQRTAANAVVVPMDSIGLSAFQRAVAWASNSWVGTGGSSHRGGVKSGYVDHGHHAAFRMSSFQTAGGYDEGFTHNEDAELDCRQRAHGARLYLDADIRIVYRPRATVLSLARQYFAYGKGRSRTVRRHPLSMRPRQLAVPVHCVVSALCLALAAWLPLLLVWPALYAAVLGLVSVQTAVKQRSLDGLMTGAAAATMHLSWGAGFVAGMMFVRVRAWHPGTLIPGMSQFGAR